jgi:hypothetical protein
VGLIQNTNAPNRGRSLLHTAPRVKEDWLQNRHYAGLEWDKLVHAPLPERVHVNLDSNLGLFERSCDSLGSRPKSPTA